MSETVNVFVNLSDSLSQRRKERERETHTHTHTHTHTLRLLSSPLLSSPSNTHTHTHRLNCLELICHSNVFVISPAIFIIIVNFRSDRCGNTYILWMYV